MKRRSLGFLPLKIYVIVSVKETLRLLVNIFSNRGFEHVQNKALLPKFIQRSVWLIKVSSP